MLSRRNFLTGFGLASAGMMLPLGKWGYAWAGTQPATHKLIVVMLRGAVDGLSVVTPYMEKAYFEKRNSIALSAPGKEGGLMDLDGFFGLHPSLSSMMPLWQSKQLAFVQASGSPATTRSHFEAQDILETGSLNHFSGPDGWMNRLAKQVPDNGSSSRAVSFGNVLPRIFMGEENIATVPTGGGNIKDNAFTNQKVQGALEQMYAAHPELNRLFKEGVDQRSVLSNDMQGAAESEASKEMIAASKGAPQADGFVKQCNALANMIRRDPNIELVFMDVGGWDTHVNQGNEKGQLANKLEKLGLALSSLADGLGDQLNTTSIVVMSEFGRTVAENGNHGTDHGHGNVMWVLGGGVKGGQVLGRWPGLNQNQLYEGRDLAVTTDFRSVIGQVLQSNFKLSSTAMANVLSEYKPDGSMRGLYV